MDLISALVFRHCCTIDGESLGWDGCSREQGFLRFFFFPRPYRPLKNTSDISLMDVTQNDWEEDEPSDANRFKVRGKVNANRLHLLDTNLDFFFPVSAEMD